MGDSAYMLEGFREMAGSASDVQGGVVAYAGSTFDCALGVFELSNPLMDGGKSPRLICVLEVADCDLPSGTQFATDQAIDVTDGLGRFHSCRIVSWKPQGPLWQLVVHDINEGA